MMICAVTYKRVGVHPIARNAQADLIESSLGANGSQNPFYYLSSGNMSCTKNVR